MTGKPAQDFGKRRLSKAMPEEAPSRKRSNHVALLLMGTMALGGGAYALMPSETCDPNQPTIAGQHPCQQRSSGSSSSGHGFYGGSGSSNNNNTSARSNFAGTGAVSSSSSSSGSSTVTRSGFGAFMSHFSGGG